VHHLLALSPNETGAWSDDVFLSERKQAAAAAAAAVTNKTGAFPKRDAPASARPAVPKVRINESKQGLAVVEREIPEAKNRAVRKAGLRRSPWDQRSTSLSDDQISGEIRVSGKAAC
jgi:hypothetical protein